MHTNDILVVAGKYRVVAYSKANGQPIWYTILVDRFWKWGGPFVTLMVDETGVYAHAAGELFRLDLQTGKILWQQKVPELGTEIASMATAAGASSSLTAAAGQVLLQKKKSDTSADGGAST